MTLMHNGQAHVAWDGVMTKYLDAYPLVALIQLAWCF